MAQQAASEAAPRVRSEVTPKWVRAEVSGTTVADSRRARIVWSGKVPRTYAFPVDDLRQDLVADEDEPRDHPTYGRIRDAGLEVDGKRVAKAVRFFDEGDLAGHAALRWDRVDAWFEEGEEVFVHPHDPHHRIDVLQSSRHVVVEVDGERVAETRHPILLFETGLPVRYYLPPLDVRRDLLRESDKRTGCPYKGFASYYDVRVGDTWHEDLVWTYRTSFQEALKVQGYLSFWNHRVDLLVDGEPEEG